MEMAEVEEETKQDIFNNSSLLYAMGSRIFRLPILQKKSSNRLGDLNQNEM